MTEPIQPIETRYDGHKFRSRLEARWAVVFNELDIAYSYEPEGWDLGELGWYLPDFWIPSWNRYVEIKPDDEEQIQTGLAKTAALARLVDKRVMLIAGGPRGHRAWLDQSLLGVLLQCRRCPAIWFVYENGASPLVRCLPNCTSEKYPAMTEDLERAMRLATEEQFGSPSGKEPR